MQKPLLIAIALLLFLPNLFNKDIHSTLTYNQKEKFNSQLTYLNTVDKIEQYIDSLAIANHISTNSIAYIELTESVIQDRFYHGFSHFSLNENWIAAFCGKMFEEGLACKVKPEDILQHSNAACSQQSIVIMCLLRKKNISYRKVGFPHHYALEILSNNNWYFVDPDMEPVITREQRMLSSWKHQNDNLKKYYDPSRFNDLDYQFGIGLTAITGSINEVPASNARLFQGATAVLSKIVWMFPLLLLFFKPHFSFRKIFSFNRRIRRTPSVSLAT